MICELEVQTILCSKSSCHTWNHNAKSSKINSNRLFRVSYLLHERNPVNFSIHSLHTVKHKTISRTFALHVKIDDVDNETEDGLSVGQEQREIIQFLTIKDMSVDERKKHEHQQRDDRTAKE